MKVGALCEKYSRLLACSTTRYVRKHLGEELLRFGVCRIDDLTFSDCVRHFREIPYVAFRIGIEDNQIGSHSFLDPASRCVLEESRGIGGERRENVAPRNRSAHELEFLSGVVLGLEAHVGS